MFFKITPSEPPIPFSLFTFLQKGTKPKCLLRKRYPEARFPLESIFPPPPQGPYARLAWDARVREVRRKNNSGTRLRARESYREVGEPGSAQAAAACAQLQAAPGVAPAGGLRRQLGLQRLGLALAAGGSGPRGRGCGAAQGRLEGTRAGALAPRGLSRETSGRLARRSPGCASPKGQAEAAGKLGPGVAAAPRGPSWGPCAHRATSCSSPEACFLSIFCAATIFWRSRLSS